MRIQAIYTMVRKVIFLMVLLCSFFIFACNKKEEHPHSLWENKLLLLKFKNPTYKNYVIIGRAPDGVYGTYPMVEGDTLFFRHLCEGENYWQLHGGYVMMKRDFISSNRFRLRLTKIKWTELTEEIFANLGVADFMNDETPLEEFRYLFASDFWKVLGGRVPEWYAGENIPISIQEQPRIGGSYYLEVGDTLSLYTKDGAYRKVLRDDLATIYIDAINKVIDNGTLDDYTLDYYYEAVLQFE